MGPVLGQRNKICNLILIKFNTGLLFILSVFEMQFVFFIFFILRTDFFSGLGWMLLRSFWFEIRGKWPKVYWDEYLRQDWLRRNRSCLRPEISRSSTFGRVGVSRGQFFDKYLKYIKLNDQSVQFVHSNLDYLEEPGYTQQIIKTVYEDSNELNIKTFLDSNYVPPVASSNLNNSLRIIYKTKNEFVSIAHKLFLMDDFKSGVCRNAFRGIVSVFWKNAHIYVAPPSNWTGYNLTWT